MEHWPQIEMEHWPQMGWSINTLSTNSKKWQAHSENSSTNCRRIAWVCLAILWGWHVNCWIWKMSTSNIFTMVTQVQCSECNCAAFPLISQHVFFTSGTTWGTYLFILEIVKRFSRQTWSNLKLFRWKNSVKRWNSVCSVKSKKINRCN